MCNNAVSAIVYLISWKPEKFSSLTNKASLFYELFPSILALILTIKSMGMKKMTGYIFIVLSLAMIVLMILAAPRWIAALLGISDLFSSEIGGYQKGRIVGVVGFYAAYFSLLVILGILGRRYTQEKSPKL